MSGGTSREGPATAAGLDPASADTPLARAGRPLRIVYFTDTYLPEVNGVAMALDAHARLLAARGHQVLIVAPKYRRPVLHVVPGVRIKRYRAVSFITNKASRIALPSVASVVATLRGFRPDVVHIHTPLSIGVIGLVATKMLRLPNVQTYHTYIPDFMQYVELHRLLRLDRMQDRVLDSLIFERLFASDAWQLLAGRGRDGERAERVREVVRSVLGGLAPDERPELSTRVAWQFTRALYNRADLVLTPSVTLKHELEQHGITAPVEYVSNGIDTSVIPPKTDYAPTGRLLHAGRLGFEKNVDVVVRAFARLLESRPEYRLDIVGDGPARDRIARQVELLGIGDRVSMPGFMERAELSRIYREYDAFVTASTIVTQGIVLLEAMSAGLPVVGVRALAIPELVTDGRAGLIVEPGDEEALAEALLRIVDDEALRARLGAGCREDVRAHAIGSVITRLEDVYTQVIEGRQGSASATAADV
jgi:glycosyltransferase involved in cell wall biosynthesis